MDKDVKDLLKKLNKETGLNLEISEEDVDEIHSHLSRDVAKKDVAILELHLEHRVGKSLDNFSVLFYCYLFGH